MNRAIRSRQLNRIYEAKALLEDIESDLSKTPGVGRAHKATYAVTDTIVALDKAAVHIRNLLVEGADR
jgi:hypothetical protein